MEPPIRGSAPGRQQKARAGGAGPAASMGPPKRRRPGRLDTEHRRAEHEAAQQQSARTDTVEREFKITDHGHGLSPSLAGLHEPNARAGLYAV